MIEDFHEDDLDSMSELHADAFGSQWSAHEIAETLYQKNAHSLNLHRRSIFGNYRLIGSVIYRTVKDESEILAITVHRKYRRRGFGQMLMEEVCRRLYHDRSKKLFVDVDGSNFASVNFYRKLKFKQVGERTAYYSKREDGPSSALTMQHDL